MHVCKWDSSIVSSAREPAAERRSGHGAPWAKLCSSVLEVGVAFAERHRGGSDRESDADGKREASTSGGTWRGRAPMRPQWPSDWPSTGSA